MPKSKEFISDSDSDSDEASSKSVSKKSKKRPRDPSPPASKKSTSNKTEDGDYRFQLSKMRFATVSEFRGKVMVGIREFYEAGGELRPGKKGISLNVEQWTKLKENMDDIDAAIKNF